MRLLICRLSPQLLVAREERTGNLHETTGKRLICEQEAALETRFKTSRIPYLSLPEKWLW